MTSIPWSTSLPKWERGWIKRPGREPELATIGSNGLVHAQSATLCEWKADGVLFGPSLPSVEECARIDERRCEWTGEVA